MFNLESMIKKGKNKLIFGYSTLNSIFMWKVHALRVCHCYYEHFYWHI